MADWIKDPEKEVYRLKIKGEDVIVGDESAVEFKSKVKLKRWGDECSIDVEFEPDEIIVPVIEDGKLKKKKPGDYEVIFDYDDENFHFDFLLYKKYKADFIEMPVNFEGLKLTKQLPLTEIQEKVMRKAPTAVTITETQAIDVDGNVLVERPEHIVGSYSVFHATKKNHILGQKNYGCGKAFHLYRPKAIDDNGVEHWIEMEIADGILKLNVSDDWFKSEAKYPIYIDPTIGVTSALTSTTSAENVINVTRGYADSNGIGVSISTYLSVTTAAHLVTCNVYTDGSGFSDTTSIPLHPNGVTEEKDLPVQGATWDTFNFVSPPSFVGGTYYRVAYWVESTSGDCLQYWDDMDDEYSYYEGVSYGGAWPNPVATFDDYYADEANSGYITYDTWIPRVIFID